MPGPEAFAQAASLLQQSPGANAVRDTIASVFRGGEYDWTNKQTLGSLLFELFSRAVRAVFDLFRGQSALRTAALWTGFALIALLVVRMIYLSAQGGRFESRRLRSRSVDALRVTNPWLAAQRAAAEGRYTEAAHFLYAALLQSLARRERLHLHPSKTAGDYARELRRQSSPAVAPFRTFVRAFELVAYGRGECDQPAFERLQSLAQPLLGSGEG
ncbi:MAG TPA: DUF4129 domain-containing protein [Gemmatimonadaceae bacterium]|nr:DUF4129 domain-containing protein [Gemmatimonadaceae bacterium]